MNICLILGYQSVLNPHYSQIDKIPRNVLKWHEYDASFYHHIVIRTSISGYSEWYDKVVDKYLKCILFTWRTTCGEHTCGNQPHLIPLLNRTCTDNGYCNDYAIRSKGGLSYLQQDLRLVIYDDKVTSYRIPWSYDSTSVYNVIINQAPRNYRIMIGDGIISLHLPYVPFVKGEEWNSKYITIGFNAHSPGQLKCLNRVSSKCSPKYTKEKGLIVDGCDVFLDRKCLYLQAFKEFNQTKQMYLNCVSIEPSLHKSNEISTKCPPSLTHHYLPISDMVNEELATNLQDIPTPAANSAINIFSVILQSAAIIAPYAAVAYGVIDAVMFGANLFASEIPASIEGFVKMVWNRSLESNETNLENPSQMACKNIAKNDRSVIDIETAQKLKSRKERKRVTAYNFRLKKKQEYEINKSVFLRLKEENMALLCEFNAIYFDNERLKAYF